MGFNGPNASRKSALSTACFAIAGTLASYIGCSVAAAEATKVSTAGSVTWLGNVPVIVAIEKGFYKQQGIEVDYKIVLNSSDRVRAVTAGDIAFANVGSVAAISDMSRGNESFVIFGNVDDSPGSEGCWSRAEFPNMASLKGRTIASNSSAEITMHGILATAGMSVKDIKYVNLSPNEFAPALARGDIDAACVWEPLLTGLKTAVPKGHLVGMDTDTQMFKKFGTMSAPDILIMSRDFIEKSPDTARAIAVATLKGGDFAREHPEETARLVAKHFRKPAEEILPGIKAFKYFGETGWPAHFKNYEGQLQELANWLHENKKINSSPQVQNWIRTDFIPKP